MVPELWRTRYIRLEDKPAWSNRQRTRFADLKDRNLKIHRAFRIKETLRKIFNSAQSAAQAEPLQVVQLGAPLPPGPIKAVVKTNWPSLLDAFDSRLTNGRVEAVNSLIRTPKPRSRGQPNT